MRNRTLSDYWDDVADAVQDARLIAWDTCHKIYLAMDAEQEAWFLENYAPDTFTGTPDEMLEMLRLWWYNSCGLRFIQAVTTNTANRLERFDDLIPQGADWDDDDE